MGKNRKTIFTKILSSTSLGFAPSGKPEIEVTKPAKKIPTPEIAFPENPTVAKNNPSDLLLVANSESSTISAIMEDTNIVDATAVITSRKK